MKRLPRSWTLAFSTGILAIVAATLGSFGVFAAQSDNTSVWDGVFTSDQAARGEDAYAQECAPCHLDDLLGDGIAPALTGAGFDFRWSDLSVGDMFASIRATMPQGAPASLSVETYVAIISYLLQENGLPAGDRELPPDESSLSSIIIHAEPAESDAAASGRGSVWDGVFTEDQAARGKSTYEQECASCHLDDLLGDGIAPSLTGAAFDFRWDELSVGDMRAAIRATMPQGAPASLSAQAYIDIISYILQANDLPAGENELPTDEASLSQIIILSEHP